MIRMINSARSDCEILFTWFGGDVPAYAEYSMQNFKKMNPDWSVKFIKYTYDELLNPRLSNDGILIESVEKRRLKMDCGQKMFANLVANFYRFRYLESAVGKTVVYCDLDCFPIAPFDGYFVDNKIVAEKLGHLVQKSYICGTCLSELDGKRIIRGDIWCMSNAFPIRNMFMLVHDKLELTRDIVRDFSCQMNPEYFAEYSDRKKKFFDCKLNISDKPFCSRYFSPVEHFYSLERFKA